MEMCAPQSKRPRQDKLSCPPVRKLADKEQATSGQRVGKHTKNAFVYHEDVSVMTSYEHKT